MSLNIIAILSIFVTSNSWAQSNPLSCHETVNVSLDDSCEALMDAYDFLSAVPPGQTFSLELKDKFGNIIPNNTLYYHHLGENITAKVIQNSNGNSCWSYVVVEDKLGPTIICDSYVVDCFTELDFEPQHFDNCTSSSLVVLSEEHTQPPCDPNIATVISTWYLAEDIYGNQSLPCEQIIEIEHIDISMIEFPPSYELINSTNLECNDAGFDENGFPLYEDTGVPTYNGQALNPGLEFCGIYVDYEDLLLNQGGCSEKYMRTWTVYQQLCGMFNSETEAQTIEFADTEDPVIICPPSRTVSTDGSQGCDAFITLSLAEYSDDCSDVIEMDIVTPVMFFNNVSASPSVTLNAGVNEIQYTVYDACDRSASCVSVITVLDNTPPVARCDKSTVVSLRSDGTALASPQSFDEGSFDDCSFYKTLVRRLDDPCGCPAPRYNDMDYVGEYNGHYYYISNIERYGFEAYEYSKAMGGQILVTETLAEHNWLNNEIRKNTDADYLIGLKDKDTTGLFKWPDHSLSNLNLWDSGNPGDDIYVVVNEDGYWETVDATTDRYFFVLELDDPCNFSDRVYFCCEDAGQNVPMVLRAIDRAGRFNDCEFTTEIQDKIAPIIQCPGDIVLNCNTQVDTSNLDIYGVATATDQCVVNITSVYDADISACGVGEIIRVFTASDANGQSTCDQVISLEMLGGPAEFDIVWPEDYESDEGCLEGDIDPDNLPIEFAYPDFSQADCTQLLATYSDRVYSFTGVGDDACFKVLRTWRVEDECRVNEPGYQAITYEQTLKIGNGTAPEINIGCEDVVVNTSSCDMGFVEFVLVASDDCTDSDDLRGSLQIDLYSDGSGTFDLEFDNISNEFIFSDSLPVGDHFALIEYNDQCGNPASCTKFISVESTVGPTAVCVPGIVTTIQNMDTDGDNIPDTTMVTLIPENLDAYNSSLMTSGSSHTCGYDIYLSFSADLNDQTAVFTCEDIGQEIELDLWVSDDFGNTSVCSTIVEVIDPDSRCDQNTIITHEVSGQVLTENLVSIDNVRVEAEGTDYAPVYTNVNGEYAFNAIYDGEYISVNPVKTDNALNGVSTLDVLKIQRHILGLESLDSPYKMIAADVDNSGNISVSDLLEIRRLILGVQESFTNVDSWRMVDASQKFANNNSPFETDISFNYEIPSIQEDMAIDFVGVKMGDVDNNNSFAVKAEIQSRNRDTELLLLTEDKMLEADKIYELEFKLDKSDVIHGYQMAFSVNDQYAALLGVKSNEVELNDSNSYLEDNVLKLSWSSTDDFEVNDEPVFKIVLQTKKSVAVSELLNLEDHVLNSEVYIDDKAYDLNLSYITPASSGEVLVYQNAPNPWSDFTEIKYYIDGEKEVRFSVFDINGRLLYKEIRQSKIGVNRIMLDKYDLNTSGILYYELSVEGQRYLKKMIVLE